MTSRCFYFAEKELIPLILLTQRMCPLDTVSVMNQRLLSWVETERVSQRL